MAFEEELKKILSWSNEEKNTLLDNFTRIKKYVGNVIEENDFPNVVNNFLRLIEKIPLLAKETDFIAIARGRPNHIEYDKTVIFSEEHQISHNWKEPQYIKVGRFNREFEPIFYGSIPSENPQSNFILSAALECNKNILDDNNNTLLHDITIGIWKIQSKFQFINLCFEDDLLINNHRLDLEIKNGLTGIQKTTNETVFAFVKDYWRFLSSLCTTDAKNYFLSIAFFCALRCYYEEINKPIVGIMYPSAVTGKQGLNVALLPEAVKSYLKLEQVVIYRFSRNENLKSYNVYPCSNLANVINSHYSFDWIDDRLQ